MYYCSRLNWDDLLIIRKVTRNQEIREKTLTVLEREDVDHPYLFSLYVPQRHFPPKENFFEELDTPDLVEQDMSMPDICTFTIEIASLCISADLRSTGIGLAIRQISV